MGKCKHPYAEMKYGECTYDTDGFIIYETEYLECLDCEGWLPMGPANDADPAVQVEIEAARLAAEVRDDADVIRTKYNTVVSDVGRGWWVHQVGLVERDEVTHRPEAQAGYLARVIHDHDTQHPASTGGDGEP